MLNRLDPEQADLVHTAKESCEILLRLIDDLLNFSKVLLSTKSQPTRLYTNGKL